MDKILQENQPKTLLRILQEKKEYISAPCNGNGTCGKCVVRFQSGATEPSARDSEIFSEKQLAEGYRLACQSYPTGVYDIEIPQEEEEIEVLSGWEEQKRALEEREKSETRTHGGSRAIESEHAVYGICMDIGTTTLAAVLVNLTTQAECQTAVSINHQRTYGADVLSRMDASNNGKKWEMQRCIRQDLQKLIGELMEKERIHAKQITKIVIAGNTTMCHLLRGFSCETLGVAPFEPVDISWMEDSASEFLGMKELNAQVVILPGISAFVGADIMAGIVDMNLHKTEKQNLLLDIGTNGEMVLGNCHQMYVTSTSAGPAFEGGNISCGMASVSGAISHISMNEAGEVQLEMIGQKNIEQKNGVWRNHNLENNSKMQPVGICGTGMVDLAYELRKHGIIDENGTFSDAYFDMGYEITEKVKFTQKDMRELQMAKAAIRAGLDILVKKAQITYKDVEHCYLAGGFGTKIDIRKAAGIGLIPEELANKTTAVGNTVLAGTKEVLTGKITRAEMEKIQQMTTVVKLAEDKNFEELYLSYMNF